MIFLKLLSVFIYFLLNKFANAISQKVLGLKLLSACRVQLVDYLVEI